MFAIKNLSQKTLLLDTVLLRTNRNSELLFCTMARGNSGIKAVIFDVGGVLVDAPMQAWREYEVEHSLKANSIQETLLSPACIQLFEGLEKGHTSALDFQPVFSDAYRKRFGEGSIKGNIPVITGLVARLTMRPEMAEALACIRAEGLKTAVLTNNFWLDKAKTVSVAPAEGDFDVTIESCRVGMRKPDQEIYDLVLGKLKCSPNQALFLDDLGPNLKAAKAMGINTIKVENSAKAIQEMEYFLGLPLRGFVPGTAAVRPSMEIDMEALARYLNEVLGTKG